MSNSYLHSFMDGDFFLTNEWAKKLYYGYAKNMPIFDYHCHLNAKEIWDNIKFESITDAWLNGDHYKWRLMRSVGISEKYITGDGEPLEKFKCFISALNQAPKNPVYHWAHKELSYYFGIREPLTENNASDIFFKTKEMLQNDDMSVRSLIKKSNVTALFTTDDPTSDLSYHKQLQNDKTFGTKVIPAFRPDKAFGVDSIDYAEYIKSLEKALDMNIRSFDELVLALAKRLNDFIALGTKASDLSLNTIPFAIGTVADADAVFKKALSCILPSENEAEIFKTFLLLSLASEYKKNGIVMEIHIGAMRNQNSAMFDKIGADTGYDAMFDTSLTYKLGRFLDYLNKSGSLPKTILFPLNPSDFTPANVLLGCFNSADVQVQLGAAWWHNDHAVGIRHQLDTFAATGALGTFLGMLTDSRSFFSYERHDYFRRILCSFIGECIESGEFIQKAEICGNIVENISYNNAVKFFGIDLS